MPTVVKIAIVELAQEVGALRLDMCNADASEVVALIENVNCGPVGHAGNDQFGELAEGPLYVERSAE